jgi:predicted transcriptional regulator
MVTYVGPWSRHAMRARFLLADVGPMTTPEIADRLDVGRNIMSNVMLELTRRGLVTRSAERRGKFVYEACKRA